MANYLASKQTWINEFTFLMHDKRTGVRRQVVIPYLDDPGFYSDDEVEDIIGHALENFERDMADRPTHEVSDKSWQHGLGQVLKDIDASRINRKELGGPKYHLLVMPSKPSR